MKQITNNRLLHSLLVALYVLVVFGGCAKMDGYNGPVSTDKTKPDTISHLKVTNFNGGAYITYTLPKSTNLLYVMAEYKINDQTTLQTKSSYYSDTITVNGFADTKDYNVTLYAVSRADVKSDPVVINVHPDTPYYKLIKPTIQITPDFGGLNIRATNLGKQSVGLILLAIGASNTDVEIADQHYTNVDSINYSIRGYDTIPQKFAVYVTDQWGNNSDTVYATISPYYETILDKSKFFTYSMASDSQIGYGWDLPYLWDDKTDGYSNGWHTNPGGSIPMLCTFGMGVTAKLSRFVLWERPDQFAFSHGNPKEFTIWGSDKMQPQDAIMPRYSDVGTVVGDWVNLGNYRYPDPPSGLPPGTTNDADNAFVLAGVNFNVPLTSPAVRYIRIGVALTWSGGDFAHLMEISLYGDNR